MRGGAPASNVRWDGDLGEFQMRCDSCARRGVVAYWPLTLEFWQPKWGMTRCRACWNARRAAELRAKYAHDPVYRAKRMAENAEQRNAVKRFAYKERWAKIRSDPVKYADYLERRRQLTREATRRYRARQKAAA